VPKRKEKTTQVKGHNSRLKVCIGVKGVFLLPTMRRRGENLQKVSIGFPQGLQEREMPYNQGRSRVENLRREHEAAMISVEAYDISSRPGEGGREGRGRCAEWKRARGEKRPTEVATASGKNESLIFARRQVRGNRVSSRTRGRRYSAAFITAVP